jgi:hypothetical protein
MIYGLFQFVFFKVPKFITDTLIEWFPTLIKLIKVLLLLILWLIIIFTPLLYFTYFKYSIGQTKNILFSFSTNQYLIIFFGFLLGLLVQFGELDTLLELNITGLN